MEQAAPDPQQPVNREGKAIQGTPFWRVAHVLCADGGLELDKAKHCVDCFYDGRCILQRQNKAELCLEPRKEVQT